MTEVKERGGERMKTGGCMVTGGNSYNLGIAHTQRIGSRTGTDAAASHAEFGLNSTATSSCESAPIPKDILLTREGRYRPAADKHRLGKRSVSANVGQNRGRWTLQTPQAAVRPHRYE